VSGVQIPELKRPGVEAENSFPRIAQVEETIELYFAY
jgi:hypothetical protein